MEFEWNEAKARSNLRDHGVSFEYATLVFEDVARLERADSRLDYGEARWVTLGLVEGIELVVVYTLWRDRLRLISARKATTDERKEYWQDR